MRTVLSILGTLLLFVVLLELFAAGLVSHWF